MFIRRHAALAALAAVLFVAGCANSSTPPAGGGIGPEPSASAPAPAPTQVSASPEAISGSVVAGVEPGCLLLEGSGKPHLLIFPDPALKAKAKVGSTVTVVGTAKPDQMTTCQQGTPFLVTSMTVSRAGA